MEVNLNTGKVTTFLKEDFIYDNKFISSIVLQDKKILILTNNLNKKNQLILFDLVTHQKEYFNFASDILSNDASRSTCLLKAKNGDVWVGTTLGLFQFDLENKKVFNAYFGKDFSLEDTLGSFPKHNILPSNSVLSLYESDENQLLIGLDGGGLVVLDLENGAFDSYNKTDGLSDNTICSILPDPDGYWLGTYNGLSFFNMKQKTFRNFYEKNGLPHNEFNRFSIAQDSNGINYFGGMNGFISFDPKEILKKKIQ